jgi:hypothetical protein
LGSDVQQYCVPLYGCFEFLSHVKKDVQHLIFLRSHLAWVSKAKSLHRDVAMVARLPSHPTSSQQLTHSSSADRSRCLFYQGSHSTDSCRLYRVERQTSRFLLLRIKRRSPVRVGLGRTHLSSTASLPTHHILLGLPPLAHPLHSWSWILGQDNDPNPWGLVSPSSSPRLHALRRCMG